MFPYINFQSNLRFGLQGLKYTLPYTIIRPETTIGVPESVALIISFEMGF